MGYDHFKQDDGSYCFPPGIYFDVPEAVYHADGSLGSSRVKAIAVDPIEAQFDHLHGEDKDTDALTFGSALHARVLEGREAFYARFTKAFDKSEHQGCLVTTDDLKDWLQSRDQSGLSKLKKQDLIDKVLQIDPTARIFEVEKAKWEAANEGKQTLSQKRWSQVELASQWIQRDPLLSAVMEDGAFIEGAPEVSIFYEDRGVRLKCRYDRLLRHAIVDVKTFAGIYGGKVVNIAIKAINRMRYDLQAADYIRGWHQAKSLFDQGLVFGEQPYDGFLDDCFARDEPAWIWVMVKSTGAPQPLVIDWRATFAKAKAADDVEAALDSYIALRDTFGASEDWVPMHPPVTLTDDMLPAFFGRD
jgi:PDDEXK-like domain of unknown function (DUF3799)